MTDKEKDKWTVELEKVRTKTKAKTSEQKEGKTLPDFRLNCGQKKQKEKLKQNNIKNQLSQT